MPSETIRPGISTCLRKEGQYNQNDKILTVCVLWTGGKLQNRPAKKRQHIFTYTEDIVFAQETMQINI